MTAIWQQNNLKYYDVPAVQALILFFYRKLVAYEQGFLNTIIQVLDMFQVLIQVIVMNNLITQVTD